MGREPVGRAWKLRERGTRTILGVGSLQDMRLAQLVHDDACYARGEIPLATVIEPARPGDGFSSGF